MEKGKIYKIVNNVNGLVYVGCTVNSLEHRFYEHIYRCFKTDYKSKLYNSMKKYGLENFTIELIEECDLKIIYETEKKYIKEYNSYENGLNTTLGGEGCLGYIHPTEVRKKISENLKNGNSHKGKTYEELYGERADDERLKRKLASGWNNMTKEDRENRINSIREGISKKSKYSVELVTEIKEKLNNGVKISDLRKMYPQVYYNFFYDLKNGRRWSYL